jgi:hypothetical protein
VRETPSERTDSEAPTVPVINRGKPKAQADQERIDQALQHITTVLTVIEGNVRQILLKLLEHPPTPG